MVHDKHAELLRDFRRKLHALRHPDEVLAELPRCMARLFDADQVLVNFIENVSRKRPRLRVFQAKPTGFNQPTFVFQGSKVIHGGISLQLPLVINDLGRCAADSGLQQALINAGCKSFFATLLQDQEAIIGWIECYFTTHYYNFTRADIQAAEQAQLDCIFYLEQLNKSRDTQSDSCQAENLSYGPNETSWRRLLELIKGDKEPNILLLHATNLFMEIADFDLGFALVSLPGSNRLELAAAVGVIEEELNPVEAWLTSELFTDYLSFNNCRILSLSELPAFSNVLLPERLQRIKAVLIVQFPRRTGQQTGTTIIIGKSEESNIDVDLVFFEIASSVLHFALTYCQELLELHQGNPASARNNELSLTRRSSKQGSPMKIEAGKFNTTRLLASGIAHNFNNLLQVIMGQASLIEKRGQNDSVLLSSARTIVETAEKGAALVSQLALLSGQRSRQEVVVNLNQLLSHWERTAREMLPSSIALEFNLSSSDIFVNVDQERLQQVLNIIFANAKEACAGLEAAQISISNTIVYLHANEDPSLDEGDYVKIIVSNNGRSMTSDEMQHCFEPFYTTKNIDLNTGIGVDGIGLGLSIASAIVRQFGGKIGVTSDSVSGTHFSIFLPLANPRQDKSPVVAELQSSQLQCEPVACIAGFGQKTGRALSSILSSFDMKPLICKKTTDLYSLFSKRGSSPVIVFLDSDESSVDLLLLEGLARMDAVVSIMLLSNDTAYWRNATRGYRDRIEVIRKPLDALVLQNILRKLQTDLGSSSIISDKNPGVT